MMRSPAINLRPSTLNNVPSASLCQDIHPRPLLLIRSKHRGDFSICSMKLSSLSRLAHSVLLCGLKYAALYAMRGIYFHAAFWLENFVQTTTLLKYEVDNGR